MAERLREISKHLASGRETKMNTVLPVDNSTLSFWRTELHELDNHRSTEDLPTQCDVLIIGAGFAGTSVAYNLVKSDGPLPKTVILEARQACSGATGRNGGHLKPDVYFNVPKYTQLYGAKAAHELAAFESSQVLAVKDLVERENIDCEFTLTRAIDVCLDQAHSDKAEAAFKDLLKTGAVCAKDVYFAKGKDAERISGVKDAKGAFSFTAGHIWPYKLIMHLLSLVVKAGVNLQTNTPVISVSETANSDGSWTVRTARGDIRTKKLVFASNGYTSGLLPEYTSKIVPVRGICSRITCPDPSKAPHLPCTYSLRFGPGLYDYMIPRNDGSIVVGGARKDFADDLSTWYNVIDDSKLIGGPADTYFDGYMQRHFKGWENSGATTDRVWTGIMGYTSDLMPHVGHVPAKEGQFILAGFNGHGMPLIWKTAKGISEMLNGKTFEETEVPGIFKTTKERLLSDRNDILNLAPR